MTTGIISGIVSALLILTIEVLLKSRKSKIKENIIIEKEDSLGKIPFDKWIDERVQRHKIEYYDIYPDRYNIMNENGYGENRENPEEYTFIKANNSNLYSIKIIELIINESFNPDKAESKSNKFLLENKEPIYYVEELKYNKALFVNLTYSNIPQFKITWKDEYGYEGEFFLSDNDFNSIIYLDRYTYNNNFFKELRESLSIAKFE